MKKIVIAAFILSFSVGLLSCGGAHGDDPGHSYMPDMYYSRAYEAYNYNDVGGERDSLRSRGIYYGGLTVPGTVARGEILPYHLTNDSAGIKSADAIRNPLDSLAKTPGLLREGERLYLINCGICHGSALDGNGPLYKGGDGPYPAKPQVLNDAQAAKWTAGHFYHVITFGKGAMGSYASQLRPEQRWLVINYIRSKQGGAASDTTAKEQSTAANQTQVGSTSDTTKTRQP